MRVSSFSDLPIGTTASIQVELSADAIRDFADFSGDASSIHVDHEYAKSRGFEGPLTHGLLIGAYVSRFLGMALPGKHGLLKSVQLDFLRPCYAPNSLSIEGAVIGQSIATMAISIAIQIFDKKRYKIARAHATSIMKL